MGQEKGILPMIQLGRDGDERTSSPVQTETSDQHPAPVLLTVAEVAAALGMSEKSVRRRIKAGVIRKAPIGGRLVRISSEELRRLGAAAPFDAFDDEQEVSIP